jgi:TPP-dependent pyruvate/acetoin dehydrogenase alpha subunit
MNDSHAIKPHLTREHLLALLRAMVRIRRFEEKCAELYQQEKIRSFLHLYIGEEAIAAGAMQPLAPADAVVATYREHGPRARPRRIDGRGDGGNVRQGRRLQPRARRVDAPL